MNDSTPPFDRDLALRRRRRMKLVALGSVAFFCLEAMLLVALPKDSPHGGMLPGLILADALIALAVCACLAVLVRKS